MTTTELDLIESPSARSAYYERTDALDKVKALSLLPDDIHVTTEMVAAYYEVPPKTIMSVARYHRAELEGNGMRVVAAQELSELRLKFNLSSVPGRGMRVFTRRTVLNVGMLLRDSDVAKRVRAYLLNVEELADVSQREAAADLTALFSQVIQRPDLTHVEMRPDGALVAEFLGAAPAPTVRDSSPTPSAGRAGKGSLQNCSDVAKWLNAHGHPDVRATDVAAAAREHGFMTPKVGDTRPTSFALDNNYMRCYFGIDKQGKRFDAGGFTEVGAQQLIARMGLGEPEDPWSARYDN